MDITKRLVMSNQTFQWSTVSTANTGAAQTNVCTVWITAVTEQPVLTHVTASNVSVLMAFMATDRHAVITISVWTTMEAVVNMQLV